ncbi:MAG: flagellar biosynthetic protein FliR [Syntrophorhabdaceae bacterium]|nr:flagellar biosynthetic protein FliR [Syntrophorhabdales bacterium]MBP9560548.1 flagellar biosynthetic protein FliR [Syntrophorhabdaceae bacterium]
MAPEIGIDIQRFALIFFRTLSILWLVPIFATRAISMPFKAGLSLIISYLVFEFGGTGLDTAYNPVYLSVLIIKEIFIGLTISFFVRALFMMVFAAAEMASLQTGFSFARFMDPITMSQSSVMEQLKNILTIMVFFSIDAHHTLIRGIFASFKELPLGAVVLHNSLLTYIIHVTGRIFSVGLRISAPLTVTLFIVELALGLLSRLIPQINVFIEGMPIKILITMVVLSFSLGITVTAIAGIFNGMEAEFLRIMRLMG